MNRIFLAVLTLALAVAGHAQAPVAKNSKETKSSIPASKTAPVQPMDTEYTESIVKNTTDKMFLTEFVDHLPASSRVPTPAKILGYPIGTPNKLTYTADQYRYYRELEKVSPRVRVFVAPEKSEQGREQLLIVISDEANLAKLARYKEITAKLGDPRTINDDAARQLINEGKAIYWASGSIHSPETGSPEMLMELAYRLAVEETPFIQEIRRNSIFRRT